MSRHCLLPTVSRFKPTASLEVKRHRNGDVWTPTAGHTTETLQVRNSQRIHELMKYLTGLGCGAGGSKRDSHSKWWLIHSRPAGTQLRYKHLNLQTCLPSSLWRQKLLPVLVPRDQLQSIYLLSCSASLLLLCWIIQSHGSTKDREQRSANGDEMAFHTCSPLQLC